MTGISLVFPKDHIFSFSKKSCKWVSLGVIPRPRMLKETLIFAGAADNHLKRSLAGDFAVILYENKAFPGRV